MEWMLNSNNNNEWNAESAHVTTLSEERDLPCLFLALCLCPLLCVSRLGGYAPLVCLFLCVIVTVDVVDLGLVITVLGDFNFPLVRSCGDQSMGC